MSRIPADHIFLNIVLAAFLVGCGSGKQDQSESDPSPQDTRQVPAETFAEGNRPVKVFPVRSFNYPRALKNEIFQKTTAVAVAKGLGYESIAAHALRLKFMAEDKDAPEGLLPIYNKVSRLMCDDREFRKNQIGFPILVDTVFGVSYRTSPHGLNNAGLEKEMIGGMTHIDKMLSVFAELGLPLDFELVSESDTHYSIRDLLTDSLKRGSTSRELEWTIIAYCHYLSPNAVWTNSINQTMTMDTLVTELLDKSNGAGACFGTHRIYALLKVRMRESETPHFVSASTVDKLDDFFRDLKTHLTQAQHPSGYWDEWWKGLPNPLDPPLNKKPETDSVIEDRRFTVTSHMLEWMAIAAPEYRPDDLAIAHAAEYTLTRITTNDESTYGKNFLPTTHAVRALYNLSLADSSTAD